MKHIALVMGALLLLVFGFNSDCRSEDSAQSAAEQTVAGADVDAKEPCKGDKQEAKGAEEEAQKEAKEIAEGAKEESN